MWNWSRSTCTSLAGKARKYFISECCYKETLSVSPALGALDQVVADEGFLRLFRQVRQAGAGDGVVVG